MAKLFSLSLFTRLYLIIVTAVIVSGTLTFSVIEHFDQKNQIDEFVFTTDFVYRTLVSQQKLAPENTLQSTTEAKQFIEDFSMNWQVVPEGSKPCDDCDYVGHSGRADVYHNQYDQFIAVYSLPKSKAWLIIDEVVFNVFDGTELIDGIEFIEEEVIFDFAIEDIAPIILLFIVLITIGSAIYWPIRTLQKQIETLIETQRQFGAGDLQVRANDTFSKPLNELATSFNSMANSITHTVNEKQIFAQAVPHEVRTPLSRIQLASGLLRKANSGSQETELLDNIDTYIDDINELISQVVAFSKLSSVSNVCETDFYQVIELASFIELRVKAIKCETKLTVIKLLKHPLTITTNPAYLRLLIDNLLKNASIYGKKQMTISLQEYNEYIELSVEDDGDGIPVEFLETVFLPFSRLDVSRSRKTGGLGLGLAISKAACNRMDCLLTVENSSQGGARFICHFLK